MLNPFTNTAFDMVHLTEGINIIPNTYGRIRELGIFPEEGIRVPTIGVEERNGILNLLPTAERGAPGTVAKKPGRVYRDFRALHIPHDSAIKPEEAEGVRRFNSEDQLEALEELMADRLAQMRAAHAITLEHLRAAALRGLLVDADGSTLVNFYTEFGLSERTINFNLDVATTEIKLKINQLKRDTVKELKGETMRGIHVLCSPGFFDDLVVHASVQKAWERFNEGSFLRDENRDGFTLGRNVTFEEYVGEATDLNGVNRLFIPADEALAFPVGTTNTFKTYFAPADFNETVGTRGLPVYARQEPKEFSRGTKIHTQSNPFPICRRPRVLTRLLKA